MAIKKVQLPDNSTQDINDSRIASADITKWNAIENFVFVQGSSSAAGNGASGEYLSTKWEGTVSGVTTPTNGMKIAYRVATNTGVSTAGAVLSIDGGTTYKPVVFNVNSVIGTRYSVGSTLLMTYNSTQTAAAYLTSGTKTTVTGCWQVMDYSASNTDTKVRQYQSGANAAGTSPEYPLLSRYGTTNVDSSYEANYARFHTGATLNTTTGGITAASFKKTGGTSSQFLKADGSVDSNTYLTTAPVTSVNGSTGDVTITVPTKVSDLTNDSGFVTDVSGKEDKSNKVTSLSFSSTDTEYPSAKTVYDALQNAGGKQYRLIASGTTSADMTSINITRDTNNEPFELTEVLVYARIRGNSVGYTGWFQIAVDNNSWSMVQDSGSIFNHFAASGDKYYTVLGTFYKLGNRVFPKNCYRSWNNDSVKDSLSDSAGSSMWAYLEEVTNANFTDNIKRIRMGGYDNGGVGAGSEYWVYGIDA